MAVHAGRALFEQGIGDRRGNAQRGVLVWVYEAGTSTLATLYTDRTKATEQDNPLTTNGLGNLAVFADPGDYEAHVDSTGAVLRFTVLPDWEDVVTDDEAAGGLPAHLSDAVDAHDASAVSFTPAGSIAATDVQAALAEVATDYASADAAHLADTSSAHVASAVGFTPAAGVAATDVQAAIVEVAGDVSAGGTALGDHLADTVDSHDASAVSFVPAGGLAATTVQAALVELDSEKEPTIPPGTYVQVLQPEQFGAGAAFDAGVDDTAAVVASFAAATALRRMVIGGNVFEPGATVRLRRKYNLSTLASQIVASCNIDGAEGALVAPVAYAGVVLLLGHETSGLLLQSASMRLPRVTKAAGVTTLPAGSVGVKVQNCYDCDITGRRVDWFETDWLFTGLGQGTAYNRINLGRVDLAKVSIALIPGAGGWVNSNRFVGGGISQAPNTLDGGLTTDLRRSGWRHLVIDGSAGVGTVNSNTFDGVSFEGDLSEFYFDIKHASNNTWQGATRFEQGTAARATTLATDTFTHTGHGLAVGDMVVFTPTTLPGGMNRGEAYFVSLVPTADTFKVAATKGGSSVSFSTNGSGVVYYVQPRILIDGTGGNTYANEIKSGYFSATGPLDIREINATRSNPVAPPLPRQGTTTTARNRIINGDFRINQRSYASGGSLAVGAFGFDRWKSNQAATSLTFTSAPQGQSVLLDGYIQQVLERASVPAGTYTLSWEGNAQGRVFNSGASAPALAQGPITVDIDGTADVVVEFFGTTAAGSRLFRVQFELGRIATPFEQVAPALQLEQCKRFFQRYGTGTTGREMIGAGIANSTTSAFFPCRLPVEMRTTPTVAVTSSSTFRVNIGTSVIVAVNNGVTLDATSNARSLRVNASVAAGLTTGQAATLDTGDGYFDLSAEL